VQSKCNAKEKLKGRRSRKMDKIELIMKTEGFGKEYATKVSGDYEMVSVVDGQFTTHRLTRKGKEIPIGHTPIGNWVNACR
jgi:L-fucose isomerase-like protein